MLLSGKRCATILYSQLLFFCTEPLAKEFPFILLLDGDIGDGNDWTRSCSTAFAGQAKPTPWWLSSCSGQVKYSTIAMNV